MNKIFRFYDAAAVEPTGSPMLDAMNEAEAAAKPAEEVKPVEETPKTKFAWGDEDRRKGRYEPKDEDEFDLGYEDKKDGVKTPRMIKLAQMKETAKFLRENDGLIRSAMGMREQLTKNPDLAKWFNTGWAKAFEGDKYNPEAVTKLVASLEGKAEVTKDKIEDATDDIKEMETLLAELDAESPQAKIMRGNINSLKATRTQLKEALGTIKTLQEKTEGHDKFKTNFEETQKTQKEEADAKQAGELFNTTFGALTSKECKFDDADDAKELEDSTRDAVANLANQGKINNDAEFAKAIQDAAKATFERIGKRRERIVTDYLKKKGLTPKEEVKPKEEIKKSPDEESSRDAMIRELEAAGIK